jgi:ribosomal protein S18 acetylase RimI-like enzyme
MNVTIRKANACDFSAIFSLMKEFSIFQKTPEKVTVTLEQMVADEKFIQCFVAETADKSIIGFASFYFTYYSWSGKGLYLDDLYVTEAFRKQGIGKMLLEKVISLAKDNQCKKVRWQVSKWNTNGIDFYKRMGATVDDTEATCDLSLKV